VPFRVLNIRPRKLVACGVEQMAILEFLVASGATALPVVEFVPPHVPFHHSLDPFH
jgi:hypothetical protein